jgi:hypothetical protein
MSARNIGLILETCALLCLCQLGMSTFRTNVIAAMEFLALATTSPGFDCGFSSHRPACRGVTQPEDISEPADLFAACRCLLVPAASTATMLMALSIANRNTEAMSTNVAKRFSSTLLARKQKIDRVHKR